MSCPSCGATARADATWCAQCHARFVPVAELPAVRRFVPETSARADQVHSRWSKSATSFGPVGRVSWTAGVVVVAAGTVFSGNPFSIAVWCLVVAPVVLRSVWARTRVR